MVPTYLNNISVVSFCLKFSVKNDITCRLKIAKSCKFQNSKQIVISDLWVLTFLYEKFKVVQLYNHRKITKTLNCDYKTSEIMNLYVKVDNNKVLPSFEL